VVRLLRLDFPTPSNMEVFVLMTGAIVLALAFGPIYCANACPFGAAQELLSLARLCVRPSPHLERRMRYVRYVVLAALLGGWMLTGSRSLVAADPLGQAFAGKLAGGAMLLAAIALVASLFSFRFWCRTFCPVGALLSLAGRIGLALRIAPRKRYDLCDLGAVGDRDVECLHCNRCLTDATLTHEKLGAKLVRFPRSSIDRWARMVVAGTVIVVAGVILAGSPAVPEMTEPRSQVTARQVDVDLIRRLIEERKLSDHEALYWRTIDGQEGLAPETGPPADASD
jgi:hypothetical protein